MVTSQFTGISANRNFALESFKAVGDDVSDGVLIDVLDEFGGLTKQYIWINYGGESGEEEMWVDGETYEAPVEPVAFAPGQVLWVEAQSGSQGLQSSGQVAVDDAVVQLCNGATMAGNFTPVPLALSDILPSGEDVSDGVLIDVLDEFGGLMKQYVWINYGGESGEEEMWVDGETYEAPTEAVVFNPGQGLWIEAQSDAQFVTFPGVEL